MSSDPNEAPEIDPRYMSVDIGKSQFDFHVLCLLLTITMAHRPGPHIRAVPRHPESRGHVASERPYRERAEPRLGGPERGSRKGLDQEDVLYYLPYAIFLTRLLDRRTYFPLVVGDCFE